MSVLPVFSSCQSKHFSEIPFIQYPASIYAWAFVRVKKTVLSALRIFEFEWVKPADQGSQRVDGAAIIF